MGPGFERARADTIEQEAQKLRPFFSQVSFVCTSFNPLKYFSF